MIARFLPNGELDESFGGDGVIGAGEPSAKLVLQPDAAILTAYRRRGRADVEVDLDFEAPVFGAGLDAAVAGLPGGDFVTAGLVRDPMSAFVLQRFGRGGEPVPSFGQGGRVRTTVACEGPVDYAELYDVLAEPGQGIYVYGVTARRGRQGFWLTTHDLEGAARPALR